MTEDYLHNVWKSKRLPFHKIKPINAQKIEVKHVGEYNENQKGPDFSCGIVEIDDLVFYGSIEIHVKSSDWYRHQHQNDSAYNNVILHVVYEYDKPIFQNGVLLPTIELKSHIHKDHFLKYRLGVLAKNEFSCGNFLSNVDPIYLESMKANAYLDRMNAKTKLLVDLSLTDSSLFYHLIASAFGTSINKQGFIELAQKINYHQLKKLSSPHQQFQLLIAESGLLHTNNKHNKIANSIWHFKGTRPFNFPDVRLKQFAQFVSSYDFDTSFIYLSAIEIKHEFYKMINDFWSHDHFHSKKISRAFSDSLIINAVVPLMWYIGNKEEDELFQNKAIELLQELPPEKNKYIDKWNKCSISAKNAFDSQSLLSLYQYYCSRKKCLTCAVGNKLLEE